MASPPYGLPAVGSYPVRPLALKEGRKGRHCVSDRERDGFAALRAPCGRLVPCQPLGLAARFACCLSTPLRWVGGRGSRIKAAAPPLNGAGVLQLCQAPRWLRHPTGSLRSARSLADPQRHRIAVQHSKGLRTDEIGFEVSTTSRNAAFVSGVQGT